MINKMFKVTFFSKEKKWTETVSASNSKEALTLLGIDEKQVIKISRHVDWFDRRISLQNQSFILSNLSSAINAGHLPINTLFTQITSIYGANSKLTKKIIRYKDMLTGFSMAEMLNKLKFNTIVVAIINSSEVSGNLIEGVKEAKKYLIQEIKIKNNTKNTVLNSLPGLLISIAIFLFLPIFLSSILVEIVDAEKMKLPTKILIWIGNNTFLVIAIIVFFIALVMVIKNNNKYWDFATKLWPFKIFNQVIKIKNAISFVSIYLVLHYNGIVGKYIVFNYRNVNKNIANQLETVINKGGSLNDAICVSDFPDNFKKLDIFNIEDEDTKKEVLMETQNMLFQQLVENFNIINGFIKMFTKILAVLAIMLIMFGMYFPIMSIGSSLSGF